MFERKGTTSAIAAVSALCITVTLALANRRFLSERQTASTVSEVYGNVQRSEQSHPAETPLQTGGQFNLSRNVIAGGGGSSTGGSFRVDATIGEVTASTTQSGGPYTLNAGFWSAVQVTGATPTPTPTPTPSPTPSPGSSTIQFLSTTIVVNEDGVDAVVTVTRSGNTSGTATVNYTTADTDNFTVGCSDTVNNLGGAFARCDFAVSLDTLTFAPGETSKTFIVPIIDDSYAEGNETFSVVLSNPTGATLGSPTTATVSITDNDSVNGQNPIFNTPFFVRMHYLDFLSREPDQAGFDAWVGVLNGCSDVNNNPACDRILVSSSFFGSQEFQLKGYFVYRFYKLAFNRLSAYGEIVVDMRAVTGQTPNEVFQKKAAFANAFVQRPEFMTQYIGLNNQQYVSTLMGRYGLGQITTPDPATPDGMNKVTLTTTDLTNQLNASTLTRAQVLRAIADSDQVFQLEFNPAFVAMQYYGYLRRTPETAGFNAWLNYLNAHPTDFRTMVNGFMNSAEYKLRFGP